MSPRGYLLAVAATLLAASAVILVARYSRTPGPTSGSLDESEGGDSVAWCAEGFTPIGRGGCFATPAAEAADPLPLIIYLHGLYEQNSPEEELDRQKRLAVRATRGGYAVLAFRSSMGVCHPTVPEYATRYCWPSNEQVADRAGEFVDAWKDTLLEAERRTRRGRRYILGFSSGGYFAGLLAVRSMLPADAFVIAHGGPVEPVRARGKKPPLLLLSADDDLSQDGMLRLDDELTQEQWPHEHVARSGGHALTDGDIEVALTFFTRLRSEPLPLHPPLSTHIPRGRLPEAGEELEGSTADPDAQEED